MSEGRAKRRAWKPVLVIAGVLAVGGVLFDLGFTMIWDGGFYLPVRIVSSNGRPFRRVIAVAVPSESWISHMGADPAWVDKPQGFRLTKISPYEGQPFEIYVRSSGMESGLGREMRYSYFRLLAVWIDEGNGLQLFLTEIPEERGRRSRELVVHVP